MFLSRDPEWERFNVSLSDGGPYYSETNLKHFIVEPWNAFSSLVFLIPAIFWFLKIRKDIRRYSFIACCVPLLILGGLGSTFFHAFRSSELLLWMDVLPILVLTLLVSTYFWHKVYDNWIITIITMIISFLIRRLVLMVPGIPVHTAINVSYAIGGVTIFLPILLVLIKTSFNKFGTVLLSVLCFIVSLIFREIDARSIVALPMGTHFLWHVFSAIGAFLLADYLYFINGIKINTVKRDEKNMVSAGIRNIRRNEQYQEVK
jgi:hypothetical protein